ncbi:hypothetical protein [Sphingomonas fennica]|uniref:Peptidoglycan endopeptidase n=1 Tax=Edaphosphingomonas fennica TaxID=114404 RepID=A0A2T4HMI4_9SPHN|nr:hypothetical protein [Sphingomonas fennica]PTD16977.1 hypothetical protein CV103_18240 [Sphingomonas fennica]
MSAAIVARARACIGARFRPQGRNIAEGLDCVGLAAIACDVPAPARDYALRGGDGDRIAAGLAAAGLIPVPWPEALPGDVLLVEAGPAQAHLLVLTDVGFVHADAGLRRVVETPGRPPWPVLGAWRGT